VKLYPAIDILQGSAVRLLKGDFDASTVYDADPMAAAETWVAQGARRLHVVDLDGAKAGGPVNLDHLRRIATETGVPVQYGGGLRTAQAVRDALSAGAERAILGTAAFTDPPMLSAALAAHGPERIAVSVDVRGGHVATHGWLETTEAPARATLAGLQELGVRHFVYTDIDHDGMLDGTERHDVESIAALAPGGLIVSGGIGTLDDLRQLAPLDLEGVIVGKALYEKRFTVGEARAVLGD
jgi:phosphoribosylformimino-5-aminoimidazole carboxamide ribotide isomerase